MSVDTYLKGKNTSQYRRVIDDGEITVMVSPTLVNYAHKVELVTRKKLVGAKLVAVAHHEHGHACRH